MRMRFKTSFACSRVDKDTNSNIFPRRTRWDAAVKRSHMNKSLLTTSELIVTDLAT